MIVLFIMRKKSANKVYVLSNFIQEFTKGKSVLVLGGASYADADGNFPSNSWHHISKNTSKWWGVDIDKEYVEKYGKTNMLYLDLNEQGALETLPKEYFEVDIILVSEVLEHLLTPIQVMKDILRHKKPSTKILISVPNGNSLGRLFLAIFGNLDSQDQYHFHVYTKQSFLNTLKALGIENVDLLAYTSNEKRRVLLEAFPYLCSGWMTVID